jgi:hypothetical protein
MGAPKKPRTLVIGIDGADYGVSRLLMAEGRWAGARAAER